MTKQTRQECDSDKMRGLLLQALDGACTDDDRRELNELLRTDATLRSDAARFLTDDALLSSEAETLLRASVLAKSWGAPADAQTSGPHTDIHPKGTRKTAPRDRGSFLDRINSNGLLVLAASVLLALGGVWHYLSIRSELNRIQLVAAAPDPFDLPGMQNRAGDQESRPKQLAARVAGLIDCVWPAGKALEFGEFIEAGDHVELVSGVLQLTLESGARVLVEGPADFVATSAVETELMLGRIAAAVPREGRGYTVMTPTAEIVDLGTEFGVSVDENGASSLHVFDGEVVARRRGGVETAVFARESQAFRFDQAGGDALPVKGLADDFVRRVGPSAQAEQLPELAVYEGLSFWVHAEHIPGVEDGERVASWPDLLVGDNQFSDDAMQFEELRRPKLVRDPQGRASVAFDGWSTSLVTPPTELSDQQTTFVVCSPGPTSYAKHPFGGIVVRSGPLAMAIDKRRIPTGWMWDGAKGNGVRVAVARGGEISRSEPSIICYQYDAVAGKALLSVNGGEEHHAKAKARPAGLDSRFLGRSDYIWQEQYFLGNLYECLVYDSPLTATQRAATVATLAKRHGVDFER